MTKRSENLGRVALGVVLAFGVGTVWFFIATICIAIVEQAVRPYIPQQSLVVLGDGTPVVKSYSGDPRSPDRYRTLEGKPRNDIDETNSWEGVGLEGPNETFFGIDWSQRIVHDGGISEQRPWYFIHDGRLHGHGYFVIYDGRTKLPLGYIGRSGSQPLPPPEEQQFPVDGRRMRHGWDATLLLPLPSRVKTPGIISGGMLSHPIPIPPYAGDFLLRDAERIHVLDGQGKELRSYRIPAELRSLWLQFYEVGKSKAMVRLYNAHSTDLFWFGPAGEVTRRAQVPIKNVRLLDRMEPWSRALAVPSPTFDFVLPLHVYWLSIRSRADLWPAVLPLYLVSAVLAGLCYRRQRRYGLGWTGLWTTLVFLFGVPAYLGYLAHRVWPPRLPCPHCGRLAPRDRTACCLCGQEFPSPAPNGIEVFAA
jgi:hypothetical protein